MSYDIAIIGGGPGGYTAAAKAAEKGFSVLLFEQAELGGTCLNRGCMPTKALLHAAEVYSQARAGALLGVNCENVSYDFAAMHRRKNEVVSTLRRNVEKLMQAKKVAVVCGKAQIIGPNTILCGGEQYSAQNIIIATGSVPACPPIPGAELDGVYTSDDLLEGEGKKLDSLIIIGGGVIGVECASIYLPLGCKVTILEAMGQILPTMDREIAQRLTMLLKKQGAAITTQARVQRIEGEPGAMTVTYLDKKGAEQTASAQGVLMATGRRANTEGLFAQGTQPEMERGAIIADECGRTSLAGVYVIGDAKAKNIQLAHVATAQAANAVAAIAGEKPPVDTRFVPACVYAAPEIASVGMTESEAKAAGIAVRTGKCLTGANGKCLIEGAESGYVKLVAEKESGRLLGAQLVCPRATDLIAELALAVQKGLTAAQLREVIHPHPTFCEMVGEAAEALAVGF